MLLTRTVVPSLRQVAMVLWLVAPLRLAAQQVAGRVFSPRMSPANPDMVAYETSTDEKGELRFFRVSTQQSFSATTSSTSTSLVALPGLSGGTRDAKYSGDADWLPKVLDGRQYFAYVVTQGTGRIYVNYLDRDGALPSAAPTALPFEGARQPRWSPDGRHLAFVSESGALQVYWNLDRLLRSGSAATARAVPIAASSSGVMDPVWSPQGSYLAFTSSHLVQNTKRTQIEVLGIDTALATVRGAPISVTRDLSNANPSRPSWSHDGRFIAYYVEHRGAVDDRGLNVLDIGIVTLQIQPVTGRILSGELRQNGSPNIAESVRANFKRGPSWTRVTIGASEKPAVVYVQLDEARNHPIYVHSVEHWLQMESRDNSRNALSTHTRTVNNSEVSATESAGFVRYTFVSVESGSDALKTFDDSTTKWARGPAPILPRPVAERGGRPSGPPSPGPGVRTATRGSSPVLAFVFPGAGQLAGGHKAKGLAFATAGVAGASLFVMGMTGSSAAAKDGEAAVALAKEHPPIPTTTSETYNTAKSQFDSKRSQQMIGGAVLGLAYAVGIIDAMMHSGSSSSVSLISRPPATGVANATGIIGVRFPIGSRRP